MSTSATLGHDKVVNVGCFFFGFSMHHATYAHKCFWLPLGSAPPTTTEEEDFFVLRIPANYNGNAGVRLGIIIRVL